MSWREGFDGTVGNTPLIRLTKLSNATVCITGLTAQILLLSGCDILAKAEYLNPGGSVKDRAAKYMIKAAEMSGDLQKGGTIVEATAGNTGIGLALIGNSLGYKSYFVLPDKMSTEKIELLRTLGATVEVVPSVSIDDPRHFSKVAEERAREIEGSLFTAQFDNPNNWRAHYETTGPEIWEQTAHKIDAFVIAAGTGGTIAGVSRYLKEQKEDVLIYMIEPQGQGVKYIFRDGKIEFETKTSREKEDLPSSVLEGIGSSKAYFNLCQAVIDGVFAGDDQLSVEMTRFLLKEEGLFVGGSSGLNVLGALYMACKLGPGHTIVTVLCDSGSNYRSKIYNSQFLQDKNVQLQRTTPQDFIASYQPEKIKINIK